MRAEAGGGPGIGMRIASGMGGYFKSLGKNILKNWMLYLLLLPLALQLFFFSYRPIGSLVIAFQNYSPFLGIDNSPFVGFDNFERLLFGRDSMFFWRAVRNTVILSVYGLAFGFPFPIMLGVMFHELKMGKFRAISQSILLVPNFLSEVIVAGMVIAFLQPSTGIINHFLISTGVIDEGIYFLTRQEFFRGIFTTISIWMGAGFSSLIYLSALTGISQELYESASLDGASRLQRIWHISLPGIIPTIVTLFIISIGGLLSTSFERVLLLYQPITFETADVLGTFVYRLGLQQQSFHTAAAAGLMNTVVALVLVASANTISRKVAKVGLW